MRSDPPAPSNQLWVAASTVTILDDTLRPIWTATDATIGCGTPPAESPIAPFGEVTRTDAHYVVPKGNELIAYPPAAPPLSGVVADHLRRPRHPSRRAARRPRRSRGRP